MNQNDVENQAREQTMEQEAQKPTSPHIYECLSNYQTNQIYFALDSKSNQSENQNVSGASASSSITKLAPFLDSIGQPRHHLPPPPPPILSSTVRRSIDGYESDGPAHLSLSPVEDESMEHRRYYILNRNYDLKKCMA